MKKLSKAVICLLLSAFMFNLPLCAANARFTDDDEIIQIESVNMLVAIGVINGYADGAFHPEDPISRAEVAKILSVVLNGGREPEDLSMPDFNVFSDIRGHWAEKYINYIASLGIVSGYGSGRFGPADTITGQQLSKMLLVSLNYDPEIERLEGTDWAANTDTLAREAGLYKGLGADFDSSAIINRNDSARLICNALYANRVIYQRDETLGVTAYLKEGSSIMENSFNAKVVTGVVVANKYGAITQSSYNLSKNRNMRDIIMVDPGLSGGGYGEITAFSYDADKAALGSTVTAVISKQTNEVFGVIDAGIGSEFVLNRAASLAETEKLLAELGLILGPAFYSVNYTPGGEYKENKAGCITRFPDFDGDGVIDSIITLEPVIAWYQGNESIRFAEGMPIPKYSALEILAQNLVPGTPVLCSVLSDVNYVSECGVLTGVLVSSSPSGLNVGGESFLYSDLVGSRKIADEIAIPGNIVVVYLDDCGYIVSVEQFV